MRFLLALLLGLTLTACGGADTESDSAGTDDDAAFATELMHRDAALLNLLDVSLGRPLSPDVAEETEELRVEATERMETAADLLEEWGEKVPVTVRDHGADHSSDNQVPQLEGMPTGTALNRIANLRDKEFAEEFATLLVTTLTATRDLAEGHDGPHPEADQLAEMAVASSDRALDTLE